MSRIPSARVRATDLETVLNLALLIDETTSAERQALIRLAHICDRELNKQSTWNAEADRTNEKPSRLARDAGCSKADCRICTKVPCRCGKDYLDPECARHRRAS